MTNAYLPLWIGTDFQYVIIPNSGDFNGSIDNLSITGDGERSLKYNFEDFNSNETHVFDINPITEDGFANCLAMNLLSIAISSCCPTDVRLVDR